MKVEYNFASSSEAVVKEIVNNDTVLTLKLVGTIVSQTERIARVFEGVNEPATGMRLTIGAHAPWDVPSSDGESPLSLYDIGPYPA